MTVRVATVLSAREWEPKLVAHARDSASVRIIVRAYQPQDIDRHTGDIDVVVVGGEVSWATPAHVASWKRRGLGVVGVVPQGDTPAERVLESGGADEVVPDTIDPSALVQAIRFVAPAAVRELPEAQDSRLTAVVGARGAPGCTEVAIAYALARSSDVRCLLLDLDLDAPAVAVRLGLQPRPDLTDAADAVRAGKELAQGCSHQVGRLDVIPGSHRPSEPLLKGALVEGVLRASRSGWAEVVADVGASRGGMSVVAEADEAILVVNSSPLGIVRAAQLVASWLGPAPALVLNRVQPGSRRDVVEATRRWTGLEPAVVLPDRRQVSSASSAGKAPDRRFARAVGQLGGSS